MMIIYDNIYYVCTYIGACAIDKVTQFENDKVAKHTVKNLWSEIIFNSALQEQYSYFNMSKTK